MARGFARSANILTDYSLDRLVALSATALLGSPETQESTMSNNDQILLLKVGFIYAVWTGYAVCLPLRTAKSSLWPRVASCLGAAAGVTASGLGLLLIAVGERGLPLLRQPLTWTAAMALNWAFWILVLIWAVTALTVERALAPSRTSPTPPTPEST